MVLSEEHIVAAAAPVNGTSDVDGAAASPAVTDQILHSGPRIQRRVEWIDLPSEYEGFRIRLWVNYPQRIFQAVTVDEDGNADGPQMREALKQVYVEHNGWLDEGGEPLPPPDTDGFWQAIPNELAGCLILLVQQAAARLPNSLLPKKRR